MASLATISSGTNNPHSKSCTILIGGALAYDAACSLEEAVKGPSSFVAMTSGGRVVKRNGSTALLLATKCRSEDRHFARHAFTVASSQCVHIDVNARKGMRAYCGPGADAYSCISEFGGPAWRAFAVPLTRAVRLRSTALDNSVSKNESYRWNYLYRCTACP